MANTIDVKVHHPGGTIVMQRPEVGNALTPAMVTDLSQALEDLRQEKKVRYVILTGAGPHFCTGMDLAHLESLQSPPSLESLHQVHEFWQQLADLLIQMLRYPKPLIAAVDGGALGAGWGLALSSDLIVASEGARFASPATRLGLVGAFVAPLLWFRCGGAIAARFLMTGQDADAAWALEAHMVSKVVPAAQVWVAANQLGEITAAAPYEALQMTKRLLNETIGEWLTTQLVVAAGMGATSCSTEAAGEGMRAFLEKRPPLWP